MQQTKLEKNTNFHHIVPVSVYVTIFLVLMVLTVITVIVAYINLGIWSVPVALAIATLKASLVVLYFMHVKYSGHLVQVVIIAGMAWFILLIFGTLQDYGTRDNIRLEPASDQPGLIANPPVSAPQQALPEH